MNIWSDNFRRSISYIEYKVSSVVLCASKNGFEIILFVFLPKCGSSISRYKYPMVNIGFSGIIFYNDKMRTFQDLNIIVKMYLSLKRMSNSLVNVCFTFMFKAN